MENNIIQEQITDDINYHTPTNTLPNPEKKKAM